MATTKRLRVATEADAKPARPKTLSEAVDGGTYLEILVAQRRQMISDVAEVSGPAKAALHRQIALHSKEIAALQAEAEQEASEDAEVADEAFDAEAL
jgi:hypothetical protein